MTRIITIVGPTAVGKTDLAIKIAERYNGEIISADSRQVYKYLNIGTAKPDAKERKRAVFHLIDFLEPDHNYSCGQFARDAGDLIEEIIARGRLPIVCGGTGLYIRSLFNPLHQLPQSDKKIKEKLMKIMQEKGIEYLYQKLFEVDPEWARMIKPRDKQRILRGLEVYEIVGKPLTEIIKYQKPKPKYQPYYVGLYLERDGLYKKIDERFEHMVKMGLVDEVVSILKMGYPADCSGLRTIGYREIVAFLQGRLTLSEAINKAKQHTRNFAKRQLTWFKKIPEIRWFRTNEIDFVFSECLDYF
ncbi:MAG: tRNA (adenosine(37)-N6)-dimethylallyltransferase MiaA [bacterium]